MRNWLEKMAYRHSVFMQGRNGYDELSRNLSITAVVFFFISMFSNLWSPLSAFYILGIVFFIWSIFRIYSKNISKRQAENFKYMQFTDKLRSKFATYKNMWRDRKTHRYIKCPSCKVYIRIRKPSRGKTIELRCPKCGGTFTKRT